MQGLLFEVQDEAPLGLRYDAAFVSPPEEQALLAGMADLAFGEVRMHGVAARRRVVQFGWRYSFDARRLSAGLDVPPWLHPLQARAAEWIGTDPGELSEVLVTEYTPGATIGWHRDAPPFGIVVGVSLRAACTFRFRVREGERTRRYAIDMPPRSAYVLDGEARTRWEHSIPPVRELRYSITFRTLRRP